LHYGGCIHCETLCCCWKNQCQHRQQQRVEEPHCENETSIGRREDEEKQDIHHSMVGQVEIREGVGRNNHFYVKSN